MTPAWAPRHAVFRRACLVSPDGFDPMGERVRDGAGPSHHALETEARPRTGPRSLVGLLARVAPKHAETMAALVAGERRGLHACLGTTPWDHRPRLTVLVSEGVERLGEAAGLIACDPSSFPPRGTPSGAAVAPALLRPPVHSGLRGRLRETFVTRGVSASGRPGQRHCMRNAWARFSPHRTRKGLPPRQLRRHIQ